MYQLDESVPKYVAVSDILKKQILEGVYNPSDKLPSERALAEQFGVSLISVRGGLKKLTEDGLIHTLEGRKGSFVSRPERVLNPPEPGVIALYTDIAAQRNPRFSPRIHGVSKGAHLYGLRLEILYPATQEDVSLRHDRNLQEVLASGRIDGLIIDQRTHPTWEDYEFLKKSGINFLLLGMYRDSSGRAHGTWDYGNWFEQIIRGMVDRKYRKIAVALCPLCEPNEFHITTGQRMISSYKRLMRELFIPYRPEYLMRADWSIESGYVAAQKLLSLDDPPEVIIGSDDYNAVGIIKAALDMGLNVPRDVKVWGNGDFLHPSLLSSVNDDLEVEGMDAVAALVQLMEGDIPDTFPERKYPVERVTTMDEDAENMVAGWVDQFLQQSPLDERVLVQAKDRVQQLA